HYQILDKLGEGGMGAVYCARDTELDRTVAIKVLPPEFARDQERLRRFVQEAKAASALNHPNVAVIYGIGEADGVHFIAMEYVEGKTLRGYKGDVAGVVSLAIQIAGALDAAQSKGITHRDIKPANIMLAAQDRVKVLDFGLAKIAPAAAASEPETQSLTTPGLVMGTVQYMSPEQALGRDADPRSDIFSLGVVLYELLTGQLPFAGATATETIHHIASRPPDPLARFNREATPELERIIRKCLEKDRERRYQSARELAIDLRNLQRDSTAATAAPVARGRPRWLLAAASLALAAAALSTYWWLAPRKPVDSIAVMPFVNAGGDPNTEYLSDGIPESIISGLAQLPGLKVQSRSSTFRYKGKPVDPVEAGRALGVRAVLTGRLAQRGDGLLVSVELVDTKDNSQIWGEQYDRKLADLVAVQKEIARDISQKLRLKLNVQQERKLDRRYSATSEAYQLYLKGRYFWNRRNTPDVRRGLEYFQQSVDKDPTFALAYTGLADSYFILAVWNALPSADSLSKAKAMAKKALDLDDQLAEAHTSLAWIIAHLDWEWSAAERGFKRALELDPNYSTGHQWYGRFLGAMGRFDEAIASVQRALEIEPFSIPGTAALGVIYLYARQYDRATGQLRKAVEMSPNMSPIKDLAAAYEKRQMAEDAVRLLRQSFALQQDPTAQGRLARSLAVAGHQPEARQVLEDLLRRASREYVSPYTLAEVYEGLGDKDRAFEWLEKALHAKDAWIIYLKVRPDMDSLRSDPRFQDLLRRMNLL
ncbi:MAG: protein kinase, partial [Acidobacteria bacterium]|nr:protein kinase [Acidobacteriota bacterium]